VAKSRTSPMPAPTVEQLTAPTITVGKKVGEGLIATSGTYQTGTVTTTVFKSANGGADWVEDNRGTEFVLEAGDVAMVFKAVDTVTVDGDSVTFETAKSGVVLPADTTIGTVTVTGPATGVIGESQTFSAAVTGDSEYLTYAWQVVGANATISGENESVATIVFAEPAAVCTVECVVSTVDNTNTDSPQSGSASYNSQEVPAPPEPGDPLTKYTDTELVGDAFTGQSLQMIPGVAQGGTEPLSYSYSWERGKGGSWDVIDGYTNQNYVILPADLGYSIRAVTTATDAEGETLRLPSTGTGLVQEPFDPINPDPNAVLDAYTQYQAASLLINYQQWHARTFVITPVSNNSFKLQPGGKLSNQPDSRTLFRQGTRMDYTPTQGEWLAVRDWLAFRWTGTIEDYSEIDGSLLLTTKGGGRFVPGGGYSPSALSIASTK